MYVSVPRKSQRNPVSLGLGLLHKVDFILADQQIFTAIRCEGQCAVIEQVNNHLLEIGRLFEGSRLILEFWR